MDGKQLPKIFIVGGGFAGLAAAKALAGARAEITLIDRRNHHVSQKLAPPVGKVLGVVDTQKQLDEVTAALQKAGFAKVAAIKGEDGVNLLERVEGFFFSDAEERVLARHIDELNAGHFVFAVAASGDRVNDMAEIAS